MDEVDARTRVFVFGAAAMEIDVRRRLQSPTVIRTEQPPFALDPIDPSELAIVVFAGRHEERLNDVERFASLWRSKGGVLLVAYQPPPGDRTAAADDAQLRRLAVKWDACVVECRGPNGIDALVDAVRAWHDSLHKPGMVGFDPADLLTTIQSPSFGRYWSARYDPGEGRWSVPSGFSEQLAASERVFMVIRYVPDTSLFDIIAIWNAVAGAADASTILVSCPEGTEPVVSLMTIAGVVAPALVTP